MIINSRASNFIFNFPKGFFQKAVEEKYLNYIKRMPEPYDTVHTFMNAQVQAVTFPSLNMEPVEQTRLYGKKQDYKNAVPHQDLFTRDMTVTIKALDGYINYWIFMDNAIEYFKLFDGINKNNYFEDLHIRFLSQEGHIINTVRFHGIILTGISEIQASYSDNNPEFKTFDCTFRYNILDIGVEKD